MFVLLTLNVIFTFFVQIQSAEVNLDHMICPAILDPFQGSNYRLSACLHQALLCPIISKVFAYVFTPATSSLTLETQTSANKLTSNNESNQEHNGDIEISYKNDFNHKLQNDINNTQIKARIKQGAASSATTSQVNDSGDEKQIRSGCDNGSNLLDDASIPFSNGSNKKLE